MDFGAEIEIIDDDELEHTRMHMKKLSIEGHYTKKPGWIPYGIQNQSKIVIEYPESEGLEKFNKVFRITEGTKSRLELARELETLDTPERRSKESTFIMNEIHKIDDHFASIFTKIDWRTQEEYRKWFMNQIEILSREYHSKSVVPSSVVVIGALNGPRSIGFRRLSGRALDDIIFQFFRKTDHQSFILDNIISNDRLLRNLGDLLERERKALLELENLLETRLKSETDIYYDNQSGVVRMKTETTTSELSSTFSNITISNNVQTRDFNEKYAERFTKHMGFLPIHFIRSKVMKELKIGSFINEYEPIEKQLNGLEKKIRSSSIRNNGDFFLVNNGGFTFVVECDDIVSNARHFPRIPKGLRIPEESNALVRMDNEFKMNFRWRDYFANCKITKSGHIKPLDKLNQEDELRIDFKCKKYEFIGRFPLTWNLIDAPHGLIRDVFSLGPHSVSPFFSITKDHIVVMGDKDFNEVTSEHLEKLKISQMDLEKIDVVFNTDQYFFPGVRDPQIEREKIRSALVVEPVLTFNSRVFVLLVDEKEVFPIEKHLEVSEMLDTTSRFKSIVENTKKLEGALVTSSGPTVANFIYPKENQVSVAKLLNEDTTNRKFKALPIFSHKSLDIVSRSSVAAQDILSKHFFNRQTRVKLVHWWMLNTFINLIKSSGHILTPHYSSTYTAPFLPRNRRTLNTFLSFEGRFSLEKMREITSDSFTSFVELNALVKDYHYGRNITLFINKFYKDFVLWEYFIQYESTDEEWRIFRNDLISHHADSPSKSIRWIMDVFEFFQEKYEKKLSDYVRRLGRRAVETYKLHNYSYPMSVFPWQYAIKLISDCFFTFEMRDSFMPYDFLKKEDVRDITFATLELMKLINFSVAFYTQKKIFLPIDVVNKRVEAYFSTYLSQFGFQELLDFCFRNYVKFSLMLWIPNAYILLELTKDSVVQVDSESSLKRIRSKVMDFNAPIGETDDEEVIDEFEEFEKTPITRLKKKLKTPEITPERTPEKTPERTPEKTPERTPEKTPEHSPRSEKLFIDDTNVFLSEKPVFESEQTDVVIQPEQGIKVSNIQEAEFAKVTEGVKEIPQKKQKTSAKSKQTKEKQTEEKERVPFDLSIFTRVFEDEQQDKLEFWNNELDPESVKDKVSKYLEKGVLSNFSEEDKKPFIKEYLKEPRFNACIFDGIQRFFDIIKDVNPHDFTFIEVGMTNSFFFLSIASLFGFKKSIGLFFEKDGLSVFNNVALNQYKKGTQFEEDQVIEFSSINEESDIDTYIKKESEKQGKEGKEGKEEKGTDEGETHKTIVFFNSFSLDKDETEKKIESIRDNGNVKVIITLDQSYKVATTIKEGKTEEQQPKKKIKQTPKPKAPFVQLANFNFEESDCKVLPMSENAKRHMQTFNFVFRREYEKELKNKLSFSPKDAVESLGKIVEASEKTEGIRLSHALPSIVQNRIKVMNYLFGYIDPSLAKIISRLVEETKHPEKEQVKRDIEQYLETIPESAEGENKAKKAFSKANGILREIHGGTETVKLREPSKRKSTGPQPTGKKKGKHEPEFEPQPIIQEVLSVTKVKDTPTTPSAPPQVQKNDQILLGNEDPPSHMQSTYTQKISKALEQSKPNVVLEKIFKGKTAEDLSGRVFSIGTSYLLADEFFDFVFNFVYGANEKGLKTYLVYGFGEESMEKILEEDFEPFYPLLLSTVVNYHLIDLLNSSFEHLQTIYTKSIDNFEKDWRSLKDEDKKHIFLFVGTIFDVLPIDISKRESKNFIFRSFSMHTIGRGKEGYDPERSKITVGQKFLNLRKEIPQLNVTTILLLPDENSSQKFIYGGNEERWNTLNVTTSKDYVYSIDDTIPKQEGVNIKQLGFQLDFNNHKIKFEVIGVEKEEGSFDDIPIIPEQIDNAIVIRYNSIDIYEPFLSKENIVAPSINEKIRGEYKQKYLKKLSEQREISKELKEELEKKQEELDKIVNELEDLKNNYKSPQVIHEREEELKTRISKLKSQIKTQEKEYTKEYTKAVKQSYENKKQINEIRESEEIQRRKLEELKNDYEGILNEYIKDEKKLQEQLRELKHEKKLLEESNKGTMKITFELFQKERIIEELNETIEKSVKTFNDKKQKFDEKKKELESSIFTHILEKNSLEQKTRELEKQIENFKHEIFQTNLRNQQLTEELARKNHELELLKKPKETIDNFVKAFENIPFLSGIVGPTNTLNILYNSSFQNLIENPKESKKESPNINTPPQELALSVQETEQKVEEERKKSEEGSQTESYLTKLKNTVSFLNIFTKRRKIEEIPEEEQIEQLPLQHASSSSSSSPSSLPPPLPQDFPQEVSALISRLEALPTFVKKEIKFEKDKNGKYPFEYSFQKPFTDRTSMTSLLVFISNEFAKISSKLGIEKRGTLKKFARLVSLWEFAADLEKTISLLRGNRQRTLRVYVQLFFSIFLEIRLRDNSLTKNRVIKRTYNELKNERNTFSNVNSAIMEHMKEDFENFHILFQLLETIEIEGYEGYFFLENVIWLINDENPKDFSVFSLTPTVIAQLEKEVRTMYNIALSNKKKKEAPLKIPSPNTKSQFLNLIEALDKYKDFIQLFSENDSYYKEMFNIFNEQLSENINTMMYFFGFIVHYLERHSKTNALNLIKSFAEKIIKEEQEKSSKALQTIGNIQSNTLSMPAQMQLTFPMTSTTTQTVITQSQQPSKTMNPGEIDEATLSIVKNYVRNIIREHEIFNIGRWEIFDENKATFLFKLELTSKERINAKAEITIGAGVWDGIARVLEGKFDDEEHTELEELKNSLAKISKIIFV